MTLVEIMAAIAVSGFVIALAAALLDQVRDGGLRISRDAAMSLRDGNGWRLVAQLARDATASGDTADPFLGDTTSARMLTRCPTANGWTEPCHVELMIDHRGDSTALRAQLPGAKSVTASSRLGTVEFRYATFATGDSSWLSRWTSSATLPAAIVLVTAGDTVVIPLGPARD